MLSHTYLLLFLKGYRQPMISICCSEPETDFEEVRSKAQARRPPSSEYKKLAYIADLQFLTNLVYLMLGGCHEKSPLGEWVYIFSDT